MKPLFRWTIGNTSDVGMDMLVTSISLMRRFHDFDCFVCHNNLKPGQMERLAGIPDATLVAQSPKALPIPPKGVAWKLYTPRLDINRHEVFIDNDLVVFKKMPKMESFLESRDSVIYTRSLFHNFGTFKPFLPKEFRLNSGLFGLPPGFDFDAEVRSGLKGKTAWDDPFDEQGLVALILSCQPTRIEIGLDEIMICHEGKFGPAEYGYHFVFANRGVHTAWLTFKGWFRNGLLG